MQDMMQDIQYKDQSNYNVEQKLQSYLRDKFSTESIDKERCIPLLVQVAKEYDDRRKQSRSQSEYYRIANEAIDTYLNNWQDKTAGEDDRGNRLNKAVLNGICK